MNVYFKRNSNTYILSILAIITILSSLNFLNSEIVCTEDELIREIIEDIEHNNKLDCLRESLPVPGETPKEKNLRLKANWDSDCSFESSGEGADWVTRLEKNYLLSRGLVDVDGKPYTTNKPEQADMCEIIRALLGNGIFPNLGNDLTNLTKDFTSLIDCPGDEGATEVCAATPFSFAEKKGWYIFLDGKGITVNREPNYSLASQGSGDSD